MKKAGWILSFIAGTSVLAGCSSVNVGSSDQLMNESSPLESYMAALSGSEIAEAGYDEQYRKVEELVSQCMADEGFSYVPQTITATTSDAIEAGDVDWNTLEFAEEYGYGIVDWPGKDVVEPEGQTIDPNQEYFQSLRPSDQEAYENSLYGDQVVTPEEIGADDFPEYDWATAGCTGSAYHEVYGAEDVAEAKLWEDPEYVDLVDNMNAMYAAINIGADLDVTALDQEWVACMDESGFSGLNGRYSSQEALSEEYSAVIENLPTDDPSFQEKTKEFQVKEIRQAVADWKCAERVNYRQRFQDVTVSAEKQFVKDNKNRLEALLLRYSGK